MIEGCLEWQRMGPEPARAVRDATAAYLEAEDAIAAGSTIAVRATLGLGNAGRAVLLLEAVDGEYGRVLRLG